MTWRSPRVTCEAHRTLPQDTYLIHTCTVCHLTGVGLTLSLSRTRSFCLNSRTQLRPTTPHGYIHSTRTSLSSQISRGNVQRELSLSQQLAGAPLTGRTRCTSQPRHATRSPRFRSETSVTGMPSSPLPVRYLVRLRRVSCREGEEGEGWRNCTRPFLRGAHLDSPPVEVSLNVKHVQHARVPSVSPINETWSGPP